MKKSYQIWWLISSKTLRMPDWTEWAYVWTSAIDLLVYPFSAYLLRFLVKGVLEVFTPQGLTA